MWKTTGSVGHFALDQYLLHGELESLDNKIVSVESQIVKIEKEIHDAEQQLEALSADSDPTIIEDVRIALAAKRKEEEQLRMKEGQLRTEKQLLRTREDLMLLDERNRNQGE